jgi:uncharacterized membrane protein
MVVRPIVNRDFLQPVSQFSGAKIGFKSKMNAISWLCSFLLCATIAMLWPLANAYAQSKDTKTCAILAGTFFPNISMQITPADQAHQMIQRKVYVACLQARGKQGASRMTAPAQAGTKTTNAGIFVTFDVPGATFTGPKAINNSGAITGGYFDAAGLIHSFLRTSDGTITPFDAPGATCSPTQNFCTLAFGINPAGTIVGAVATNADFSAGQGFLRTANGTFTEFAPPFAEVTEAFAINPDGVAAGPFLSSKGGVHGFLRAPNGTFTTFDPLGSVFTQPNAINPAGTITGWFLDVRGVMHGFLRTSDGTITEFDAPSSLSNFPGTEPNGINPAGTIVGNFFSSDFSASHGFLRAPNGTFTVFDPPDSLFTFVPGGPGGAFNPAGTVTGNFTPPDSSVVHGFVGPLKNMP